MSTDITTEWLEQGMFEGDQDAKSKAERITEELGSHANLKTHARHIHRDRLVELGLKIGEIEQDKQLQDIVLSLHHACIHTLTHTAAIKLIENQKGIGLILSAQFQVQPGQTFNASGALSNDQPTMPQTAAWSVI